ncbi:MAG: LPP20 family lipoprotein [Sulfurimonas sp.]|nr:LPP20 family lipoprotein [Sulfurimonas sp.]
MFKTVSLIVFTTILSVFITGCNKKVEYQKDDFSCKQENVLAPTWTCIPDVDNYYSGVGIAQKTAAGMAHMKRVAVANGRSDLAQQIKSDIKDKITIYSGTTGVGSDETIDQTTEAVTKQLAKVSLVDSKAVDSWTAPSGALYLLVTVPKSSTNKQIRKNLRTSYKNERALWQQFKAKNALENLEKDFAD